MGANFAKVPFQNLNPYCFTRIKECSFFCEDAIKEYNSDGRPMWRSHCGITSQIVVWEEHILKEAPW